MIFISTISSFFPYFFPINLLMLIILYKGNIKQLDEQPVFASSSFGQSNDISQEKPATNWRKLLMLENKSFMFWNKVKIVVFAIPSWKVQKLPTALSKCVLRGNVSEPILSDASIQKSSIQPTCKRCFWENDGRDGWIPLYGVSAWSMMFI